MIKKISTFLISMGIFISSTFAFGFEMTKIDELYIFTYQITAQRYYEKGKKILKWCEILDKYRESGRDHNIFLNSKEFSEILPSDESLPMLLTRLETDWDSFINSLRAFLGPDFSISCPTRSVTLPFSEGNNTGKVGKVLIEGNQLSEIMIRTPTGCWYRYIFPRGQNEHSLLIYLYSPDQRYYIAYRVFEDTKNIKVIDLKIAYLEQKISEKFRRSHTHDKTTIGNSEISENFIKNKLIDMLDRYIQYHIEELRKLSKNNKDEELKKKIQIMGGIVAHLWGIPLLLGEYNNFLQFIQDNL